MTTKPQRVTVMNKELALYRGSDGELAHIEVRCAHRGVALTTGESKATASMTTTFPCYGFPTVNRCALPAVESGSELVPR